MKKNDTSARITLGLGLSSVVCFQLSVYMLRVVFGPSARVILPLG